MCGPEELVCEDADKDSEGDKGQTGEEEGEPGQEVAGWNIVKRDLVREKRREKKR